MLNWKGMRIITDLPNTIVLQDLLEHAQVNTLADLAEERKKSADSTTGDSR